MAEILLVYPHESSFVLSDRTILSSHFTLDELKYSRRSDLPSLVYRAARCDVVFSWFALGYATAAAALSRVGGPRTIIVTGGWDVAVVPEISYGIMLSPGRRWKVATALSLSDRVLAISWAIAADVKRWAPRSHVLVCPLGFDADRFRPNGPKEQKVLTVGNVTRENIVRKGIRTFLDVSRSLPDVEFVLVGHGESALLEELRSRAASNLRVAGYLPEDRLIEEMQSAKVYAQLSAHEGFGCALAEAMLCACVPVVTDRGAIPEVVGDCGFYAPFGDAGATARAVKRALTEGDGRRARDRICRNFSIRARETALTKVINDLMGRDA